MNSSRLPEVSLNVAETVRPRALQGQQAGDGVGGDIGMLAGEAGEEDQEGVALSEGQEGGAVVAEVH